MKIMLKDKSVAEDTREADAPVKMIMGAGHFTENFERHLLGLKVGDKNTFMVEPEDGFGERNPDNVHTVSRDRFPKEVSLTQGLIFLFARPDGQEIPGMVKSILEDKVIVDFNHPLSGEELIFEIEVLEIETPVKH
ncbi:MAG: peptidylprolyl isomerase [Gammaproteobacteria bacterium]|nr:peptidylprolyl isomerase [Gammaproteobacteria bacterium]